MPYRALVMNDEQCEETSTSLVMSNDEPADMRKTSNGGGGWARADHTSPLSDDSAPVGQCASKERALLGRPVSQRTRSRIYIVAVIVFVTLIAAIAISSLVYLISETQEQSQYPASPADITVANDPEDWQTTDHVFGVVRVIDGPFSKYDISLKDQRSVRYTIFKESFTFQMDLLFGASRFQDVYNGTYVKHFANGSVYIHFMLFFKHETSVSANTLEAIRSTIVNASKTPSAFGGFILDDKSTSITSRGGCEPVLLPECEAMPYKITGFPNVFGHSSQGRALEAGFPTLVVLHSQCYEFINTFWCAMFFPPCQRGHVVQPCRDFCLEAKSKCSHVPGTEALWTACQDLPDSSNPDVCVSAPVQAPLCIPSPFDRCSKHGFQTTASPHFIGRNKEWVESAMEGVTQLVEGFHCYDLVGLFGCSVISPRCVGSTGMEPERIIPPCRSLCEAAQRECTFFFELMHNAQWAASYNCSELVDSLDENVCTGGRQVAELIHQPKSCLLDEVMCDGSRCILQTWLCDGVRDCEDGTDESHCAVCGRDFICDNSQCISQSKVCDGVNDCVRGEDEAKCVRLRGVAETEGTLQVYTAESRTWNYICGDSWNDDLSNRICLQALHRQTCPSKEVVYLECNVEPSDCSIPLPWPFSELQLVAGVDLPIGAWPWLVSIHGGPNRKFFCGATLLSSEWVMTAAHCIGEHLSTVGWSVTMGHTRRAAFNEFQQQRSIRKIVIHPNFSRQDMAFDVALMKLDYPVKFDRYVAPLCLPTGDFRPSEINYCYVAGWGKLALNELHYRPVAQIRRVEIVNEEQCRREILSAKPHLTVSDSSLCARGFCGMDACRGDSGGAMVCQVSHNGRSHWTAAGIVSWGVDCLMSKNLPGVYTDVNKARDWLIRSIGI